MFSLRRCSALHVPRPSLSFSHPLRANPRLRLKPNVRHAEKYHILSTNANANGEASRLKGSLPKLNSWVFVVPTTLLILGGAGVLAYNYNQPFRHTALAAVRCSRIAGMWLSDAVVGLSCDSGHTDCRGGHPWGSRLQDDVREDVRLGGGTAEGVLGMPHAQRTEGAKSTPR